MKARMDSMARRDATSPAACPPIPSATTNNPMSRSNVNRSSLPLRMGPHSDTP